MPINTNTNISSAVSEMITVVKKSEWQKKNVTTHLVNSRSKLIEQRSIMAAISRAAPYDRIEIEGGEYHEMISITFPIEIVGTIGEKPIIVSRGTGLQQAAECDCYIEGIIFENRSKDNEDFSVVCSGGSPIFVNCKMSNCSVVGSSRPTFSNCEIADSNSGVGVKVSCRDSMTISAAPSPTFDNCKVTNHFRCGIVVEGVGSALSAMFRSCRINQVQGATCVACVEGVGGSPSSSRTVTFQDNMISYRKAQVNSQGEVELINTPGVQTDYRYSASVAHGAREPAAIYINGCGKSLRIIDNDFSDGAVGFFMERSASPLLEGNKCRRMSSCGMRIAVGHRGASADTVTEVKCGITFERCTNGIEVLLNNHEGGLQPASQSPVAAALADLYHSLFAELDNIYLKNGAIDSALWSDKLQSVVMELCAKCNIPSHSGAGGAEHMSTAMPNWDVVQALAQMHHTDLAAPSNDVEHARRDVIHNFVEHVVHALQSVAPSAVHIKDARFTDSQRHAVKFGPGSYGILSYCHFEGVTGGSCVVVERDSFPVIANCRFSSCARSAVECHRSAQPIFVANIIGHGTGETAIHCRPGSEGLFAANKIEFNSGFGIVVEGAATPTFFRNLICNNTLGGALIHNHSRPLFDRNAFKANKKQIVVSDYSAPKLFYNDIFAGAIGVSFTTCAVGYLTGNCIFDNTDSGVSVETDADPRIEENLFARNVGNGVFVHDNGLGTIANNLIVASGQSGVVSSHGGDCTCRGNTIGLNTLAGIQVIGEGLGLFEKNDIFCSQVEGNVVISGKHSNPTFDKNRIWRSRAGGGVISDDGAGGIVKRNTIVSNGGCGIGLYRRAATVFEHNRIESQLIGVCASLVSNGIVRKNKICYNGRCGVYVDQLAAPEIRDNSVDMNYCGLELRALPSGKIIGNSLEGNVFGVISGQTDALPACVQDVALKHNLADLNSIKSYSLVASAQARRPSLTLAQQLREQQQTATSAEFGVGETRSRRNSLAPVAGGGGSRRGSLADLQDGSSTSFSYDGDKVCLVSENHIAFNGICGVAILLHAGGKFEKNNILGNAFSGVLVTAKRAFELHDLANAAYLKENNFHETANILATHKTAPSFPTDVAQAGLYGTAELEDNNISLHTHAGIFVEHFDHASEFRFTSNEIHKNSIGIRLGNGARCPGMVFDDNSVTKNVVGLHAAGTGSAGGTFFDNVFDLNSFAGAILGGDCCPKFQNGNQFTNSRYFGCWVMESANPVFEKGNIFSSNVVAGVALQHGSTTAAAFNGCVFKHNDRFGIFVYSFDTNPKFNHKGDVEMPKRKDDKSVIAEAENAKKKAAVMDPLKKISCIKNCIIRDNGLVGVFVGALSKEYADDIHGRGSVHYTTLLSTLFGSSSNEQNNNQNINFSNFTAFAQNELDETVSATAMMAGPGSDNMSSPQMRERQSVTEGSGSFNSNKRDDSSSGHFTGPSAMSQEPSPPKNRSGIFTTTTKHSSNAQQHNNAEGGRSLAGEPPYKGFIRGGSCLFYQCAIKGNRLGTMVDRNADPVFMRNVLASNYSAGAMLSPGSIACLNDNVFESNALTGFVACPQSKSTVIACEILENNRTELLESITSKFDEKMHPIGGVAALVSLETVKFTESDLNHSPSRWTKNNMQNENDHGANAEALVKKMVAQLSMVWVACARADSRMAHRSAHHFSSPSKFRLSPHGLFSITNGNNNNDSSNSPKRTAEKAPNPRRSSLGQHIVTVQGRASTSDDFITASSTADHNPPPPQRLRSRSVVTLKPLNPPSTATNNTGAPPGGSWMSLNELSSHQQSSSKDTSSSALVQNQSSNIIIDAARVQKFRLNSLVHGVGIWVEEGSQCKISHNTVFGHSNAGILITTEGLTDEARNAYESEMMAQTAATVAPGDRFSTALQEAMAFVAGGSIVAASALRMNLIHHNRGVGVRVICCSTGIVEGIQRGQRGSGSSPSAQKPNVSSSKTTSSSSAAAALKAQVAKKNNDLLDLNELADAPGCSPSAAHEFLSHITSRNASLSCPGLGDVNVAVVDRILNSDEIIGGSHDDASKSSLVRVEDNEIEFNLNGGLLVEFVLCSNTLVSSPGNNNKPAKNMNLNDTRTFNFAGGLGMSSDTPVAPTRIIGNTFKMNGKAGSIMVRSAIHVDMLSTSSHAAESAGGISSPLSSDDYVNSLIRSSSLPGLAKVSDFYMPCVIESNTFVDSPSQTGFKSITRAPCVAIIGHSTCNVRFNDFHNVSSGCAIVVARETYQDNSPHSTKDFGEPRTDALDPAQVASGVVIGPSNTFKRNNIDVCVSGTALHDCAVVGNVFKDTKGICVLVTGGSRPLITGNRFHGQEHVNLAALKSVVGKVWEKVVALPSGSLSSTNGTAAITSASRHTSPWILANQFDGNCCAMRLTEDSAALASLNWFSGNLGPSIAIDSSPNGASVVERNIICNSHEEGILVEGFRTSALIRKNLFRDIVLMKSEKHSEFLAERDSYLISAVHVRDGACPWIDSNGFQDVVIGVLLQSPGSSCAVSRNAFFRCGTGTLIGHSTFGSPSLNNTQQTVSNVAMTSTAAPEGEAASSSSPLAGSPKLPDFSLSSSVQATLETIKKVVKESHIAVVTHNVYECPLGVGVHVVDAASDDAAAISSNVFLSTTFCTSSGGKSIAALKNVFIGAVTSLGGGGSDQQQQTREPISSKSIIDAILAGNSAASTTPQSVISPTSNNNNSQLTSPNSAQGGGTATHHTTTGADISLQVQRGSRTTFLDNFIIGSKIGAAVEGGAEGLVQGGIFYRCSTAVEMHSGGVKTVVDSCSILSCNGIALRLASGSVRRCKVYKTSGNFAVDFSAAHQKEYATLSDSEVTCCDNDAIRFSGSGVIENSIVSIAKNGVKFTGGLGAVSDIRSCHIMDMEKLGVLFTKSNNGAVIDSDVYDCGICSVALEDAATGEVDGSRISSTLDHGAIDMETGTRVKIGSNTIRNQFSPSYKGKLSQVRQKETIALVNKVLDGAVGEEEKALGNAKWAVEQRERLLGGDSAELSIRAAHKIMFENAERNAERANYAKYQRDRRMDPNAAQQLSNNNKNNKTSSSSNALLDSVPSFASMSPSRSSKDRGFELSNFIAQKKASRAQQAPNLIQVASEQPKQKKNTPINAISEQKVQSSLDAVSKAFDNTKSSTSTIPTTSNKPLARKSSFSENDNNKPRSRRGSTVKQRKDDFPAVASKKTVSSMAKETEADQSVQRLHRKDYSTLPDISPASRTTTTNDDDDNANDNNNNTRSKSSRPSSSSAGTGKPKRSASSSSKKKSSNSKVSFLSVDDQQEMQNLIRQPPKLSRVLVHSIGDAEESGITAQVTQTLEDALGSHCMIMKTTSDDPVEAMLSAASCSHVIVVYPNFPMRKRPTEEDDKALLAISCYVELALKEKLEYLNNPVNAQQQQNDNDAVGGKPKIIFSGAYCICQPPPEFASTLPAIKSPQSVKNNKGVIDELLESENNNNKESSNKPSSRPASSSSNRQASQENKATAFSTSPTLESLTATIDRSLRLPPTFAPVNGAGGLFQNLTGKKAPKGSAASTKQPNNRRRSVSIIGV